MDNIIDFIESLNEYDLRNLFQEIIFYVSDGEIEEYIKENYIND